MFMVNKIDSQGKAVILALGLNKETFLQNRTVCIVIMLWAS